MARIGKVNRQRPAKKKFRIPSAVVQWGVIGIVAVGMVILVVRTLSHAPAEPPPAPTLANAHTDLATLTLMLGDITLDSAVRSLFPTSLEPRLAGPDSMLSQRRWYDAITQLQSLLKRATPAEAAAVRACMGVAYYAAANPDRALFEFRKAIAADTSGRALLPWLEFSAGYLFQSHGFADSAIGPYGRARTQLAGSVGFLRAATENNAGLACAALKDTAGAAAAFRTAADLVDSLADPKSAATVRANQARASRRR